MKFPHIDYISHGKNGAEDVSPEERKRRRLLLIYASLVIAASLCTLRNLSLMSERADVKNDTDVSAPRRQDNPELQTIRDKFAAYGVLRERTRILSEVSEASGLSPITAIETTSSLISELPQGDYAPSVIIRGLVILGADTACTLDIEGEEPGRVFKSGMAFGGGKGKIIEIDSKGVSWSWFGKKYRTDL